MAIVYSAHATAIGGREGTVETEDGKLSFKLDAPGSGGPGTNPEQLFAAGYAACFSGAAAYLAKQQKIDIGAIQVKIDIDLNKDDNGFHLSGAIDVALPGIPEEAAIKLVKDAHAFCPYSRATDGNVTMALKLNGAPIDV